LLALLTLPSFIAFVILETRKSRIYWVTFLYLATSAVSLLTGTRMATFSLIVTLWFIARMKSVKKTRVVLMAAVAALLIVIAIWVQTARFDETDNRESGFVTLGRFVGQQGASLVVTEVAVKYRHLFQPYVGSYMLYELETEFVSSDVSNYFRGRQFGFDVSAFLNREQFRWGFATAGSYVGEAYALGGVAGVILVSLLIGCGLRFLYQVSSNPYYLFWVAMILPEVFLMPRGWLMGWASAFLRTAVLLLPIGLGWAVYLTLRLAANKSYGSLHGTHNAA
jgi:oligosaccharide repeat unit polymerase